MSAIIRVPFVDLKPLERKLKKELDESIVRVLKRSWYIGGEEDKNFELEFADYIGVGHCVGCGNGLDALALALRALGIGAGDEVIVPANTFIATALAVTKVGARPVLVDPVLETFNIDPSGLKRKLSEKTRAVMPVHLYGQPADMDSIMGFARENDLIVVEDCAQAHGARYKGRRVGTFGDAAGFSFYPGKNLGGFGDGGAVVTDSETVASMVRALGNYGSKRRYEHVYEGVNSRLDELQAAVLAAKLPSLDEVNAFRASVAERYLSGIDNPLVRLPHVPEWAEPVWHIFALRCEKRNALKGFLQEKGVGTNVHYPIPIHLQGAYRDLGFKMGDYPVAEVISRTELSLPMFWGMTDDQVNWVIESVNAFKG